MRKIKTIKLRLLLAFAIIGLAIFASVMCSASVGIDNLSEYKIVPDAMPTVQKKLANKTSIKKSISEPENYISTKSNPSGIESKTVRSTGLLYNLDDEADYFIDEYEGGGYAIYAHKTMELMEYSLQGSLPYQNSSKKYYAGPANYLQKCTEPTNLLQKPNEQFLNLATGEQIELAVADAKAFARQAREALIENKIKTHNLKTFNRNRLQKIKRQDVSAKSAPKVGDNLIIPTGKSGKYISNAKFFLTNPTHGDNYGGGVYGNGNTGTCGPVAAQLLLGYNNYYNDRRIIPDRYLNGFDDSSNSVRFPENNPNRCGDPMLMTSYTTGTRSEDTGANSFYSTVISSIMAPNTSGAYVYQVHNGINDYLSGKLPSAGYEVTHNYKGWFFGWRPINSSRIYSEIDNGRPLIIKTSGYLGGSDHFVVGYGYEDYTYPDSGSTYSGFVVHYGWHGDNNVWINNSWCDGYVTLKINHTHQYSDFGSISGTNRREYKCYECGHRTDAALNMTASERYAERVVTIPQGNDSYKDYYVTFGLEGNKTIQTFGSKDTTLSLYDTEYKHLTSDDDSGHGQNALMNYTVTANTPYILRVKFYSSYQSGEIRFAIVPNKESYLNQYEKIDNISSAVFSYGADSIVNGSTVDLHTFTPACGFTYKFYTTAHPAGRIDMCLYLIDPRSTELISTDQSKANVFNDDGNGNLQAVIQKRFDYSIPYLLIISPYSLSSTGRYLFKIYRNA